MVRAVNTSTELSSAAAPKTGLLVIFLTVFIDLVGFSIIFPLFPQMLEHYLALEAGGGMLSDLVTFLDKASGADPAQARMYTIVLFGGLLGSLYSVLQFIFAPLWGAYSDRVGRRPVLMFTVVGVALSYLLWFFSGSFLLLIGARVLGGIMSGNISVATAAVADVTDEKNRSKGMGALGAAFGLGFILGPALGGLLAAWWNPATEALFLGDTKILDIHEMPGVNPFSAPALAAFMLSCVNAVWIVRKFKETLRDDDKAHSAARPINPAAFIKPSPFEGVSRTYFVYFVYLLAFTGMEFTLTFLARDRFQYTPAKNALLFVFVGFLIAFVQGGVVRRIAPKLGERKVTLIGLLLIVPGLVGVGFAQTQWLLYLGLGTLAVGSALATPTLSALVSLYTPSNRQGEVLGVFRSLGSLARAIGPIVACGIYWKLGSQWPYFGAALLLAIPLVAALGLPDPKVHQEPAAA